MQHHPVIKLQLEASNEGTHQRIPQRNAETKSLVAGTKLSTVEEVCLEDKISESEFARSVAKGTFHRDDFVRSTTGG